MSKAFLVLADGSVYTGKAIGAKRDSVGELVFSTGVCGYIETLTDPSYYGQIVMQTFPVIGNYGIIPDDFEGDSCLFGYVVRECCDTPSNFRSRGTLESFLVERDIPGISGIDTREITRKLRSAGVMNACICHSEETVNELLIDKKSILFSYRVTNAVKALKNEKREVYTPDGEALCNVALIDYGAKRNIIRELCRRGAKVTVLPSDISAEDVLALDPDGLMLSNGPGDPEENTYAIEQIRKLLGRLPIFGICLGHQLTALAAGGRTYKLKYGHRGVNQPVMDYESGRTFITTQNHGYAVDESSLPSGAKMRFKNANDGTCEGVTYEGLSCFTVQFHPEACGGPADTMFLFDDFMKLLERGE